ncbi:MULTISPECIES: outer membrane beta-barrel protein [unclassified Beijerinckia]|uniref:outer membrane protein n=1 Tax=unclassified Beijerinckia TaxID=2638183 RepID=UPI00089B7CD7|nr:MULTISPECIES: outer membrane beta-barrel protein [unclassified Beijerinckia]MDH7795497.1 outer membrane immunogenic protein [Beijerinckia sp. GAS462]SEC04047.1 outer membrane immunogenic protein [Beijerinckia sp. 28-YEA-48]
MRHLLLGSVALLGLIAGSAQAADLPRRAAPAAPVYYAPIFTWTGFYVGLNAGGGFSTNNNGGNTYALPAGSVVGSPGTSGVLTVPNGGNNQGSFIGGAQIGYNYQFNSSFVGGLEADIQYANLTRRNGQVTPFPGYLFTGAPGLAFAAPPATVVSGNGANQNYFGTVRARLGVAFDRTLVYATGGLAYGGGQSRVGYALGGGVEYAFSNNWSAKLEALYIGINRNNNNNFGAVFNLPTNTLFLPNSSGSRNNGFVVVRAGINYRFGGAAGPVVASY